MNEPRDELLRLLRVDRLPVEYWGGRWHWPSNAEPEAIVTFAHEPSPETGHIGWCWWALGKMGESETYEAAKESAVNVVHERKGTV